MRYTLVAQDPTTGARAGLLETAHGVIETPIFMPVGTVGSVKGVSPRELKRDVQAQIILGNTYHLSLRPEFDVLESAGGLHRFMGWDGPILTDSGGFQVFSLKGLRKVTDEGVAFKSHLDGRKLFFTPENVMDAQRSIGSDIMMAFDECPPYGVDEPTARRAHERTLDWLARCKKRVAETEPRYGHEQTLFPIVQGGVYENLRRESAERIVEMGFDGHAVGGLSVGESHEQMVDTVDLVNEVLPQDKPRYLMGVGTPKDLLACIGRGIDMFDCVMPTRNARNGGIFTTQGRLNITNRKWREDHAPIDPVLAEAGHYASGFSKAYLRHLTIANEALFVQIASLQNLSFYLYLVREARKAIVEGRYAAFVADHLERWMQRL
jgi:queuine tRNA-ribosyltransferase